jgi:hypothetical protein
MGIGFAMAYEFAVGNIPARMLGFGLLALIGCLATVVVLRRSKVESPTVSQPGRFEESSRVKASMRMLKVAIVFLPIILIFGMWLTRGQPLAPRLVGAAVNLFFTFWLISILRRAKRGSQ